MISTMLYRSLHSEQMLFTNLCLKPLGVSSITTIHEYVTIPLGIFMKYTTMKVIPDDNNKIVKT